MTQLRWHVALVLAVGVVCGAVALGVSAQGEDDLFRYARIYTDDEGVSHDEDVTVPFQMREYAPPASPMGVSATTGAESVTFIHGPLGWDGEWHPTPRAQWAVVLTGRASITVGDGEVRTFGPGDLMLLDDTTGRGHLTEVVSPEGATAMMVPVIAD